MLSSLVDIKLTRNIRNKQNGFFHSLPNRIHHWQLCFTIPRFS